MTNLIVILFFIIPFGVFSQQKNPPKDTVKTKKEISQDFKVGDIVKFKEIQDDGWNLPSYLKNREFKVIRD